MKHLLQTLAQKNAATRLWVTRGLDAALFLGLTFTIMGVFRASSAVRSPNLFQAMAPFTMIVLIVLMANHIENVAAKFRKIIQAGPQVRRSLTLFLMGPNLTALFLTTSADVGLLPARLTSLPILGVLIMLALGLFLHSAVEAQDATGGG